MMIGAYLEELISIGWLIIALFCFLDAEMTGWGLFNVFGGMFAVYGIISFVNALKTYRISKRHLEEESNGQDSRRPD